MMGHGSQIVESVKFVLVPFIMSFFVPSVWFVEYVFLVCIIFNVGVFCMIIGLDSAFMFVLDVVGDVLFVVFQWSLVAESLLISTFGEGVVVCVSSAFVVSVVSSLYKAANNWRRVPGQT